MINLKIACLLIAPLCLVAPGQTPHAGPGKYDRDEQELAQLVQEECEGVLENHAAELDRILADEFQMHTVDGHTVPKAQFRQYLRAQLPPSIKGLCEIRDLDIKVSGHKATTEGRMRLQAQAIDGTAVPLQFKFRQSLVWRAHRWQATAIQFSLDQP